MRKPLILGLTALLVSLAFVDTSQACGRKKKKPPPPKCDSDTSGDIDSAGGGSAGVTFGPASGTGQTFASNGMSLPSGTGCSCALAVKKNPGVGATGVNLPGYPSFSPSADPTVIANAQAFVKTYLRRAGKDPANFDVFVFQTADGVTIPSGVDFNLQATFSIPSGSNGSELAEDITTLGLFMYDANGDVFVEPNDPNAQPISLDEYQARDFDSTTAALFKAQVEDPGAPLRLAPEVALSVANTVCLNGGFNCDVDHDGLVDRDDLEALAGTAVATTACPEPAPKEPLPTEPIGTLELFN